MATNAAYVEVKLRVGMSGAPDGLMPFKAFHSSRKYQPGSGVIVIRTQLVNGNAGDSWTGA